MKRSALIGLAAAVLFWTLSAFADANGTVRIQNKDGTVQVYENVSIQAVPDKLLRVTTADGKGTLIIDQAACSYVGELMRCYPYSITLNQDGGTHPLDFEAGTLYVNRTDVKHNLPLSTTGVPARSIVLAIRTQRGTIIAVTGSYTKVAK